MPTYAGIATSDIGIGARIAAYRRTEGLTQSGLAMQAAVSYSLLVKVEQGRRPASATLLASVARVLHVPVTALTGQPYVIDHTIDRLNGPLSDLRAALDNWDLGLDDQPVRSMQQIDADVHALVLLRRASTYGKIAVLAPALIDELVQLSQTTTGHHAAQAHSQLVHVYRAAYDVAYGLGLTDLVSLLLARMEFSAKRSDDPYLIALYRYMRAYSTFTTGRHDIGRKIISQALDDITTGVRAESVPALCAAGNLNLRGAILATRQGDGDSARHQIAEASRLAQILGREVVNDNPRDGVHISFGPTNVGIHAAAVEMELGNHARSLQLAAQVHPVTSTSPERRAHFMIDTARSQLWTGKNDKALATLIQARQLAPQLSKYHPAVRETVAGLVHSARRTPDTLISYASWCGVQL